MGDAPWKNGPIAIPKGVLDAVDAEAVAAYARDEEACGLLVGPADDPFAVDAFVAFENRANALHALDPEAYPRTGSTYFDLHPLKFQRAVEEGDRNGRPVKVLFHSHLDAGAYFSETDAAAATGGGDAPTYELAYLVTSVVKGVVDARGLFAWDPATRSFVPTELRIAP